MGLASKGETVRLKAWFFYQRSHNGAWWPVIQRDPAPIVKNGWLYKDQIATIRATGPVEFEYDPEVPITEVFKQLQIDHPFKEPTDETE